MNNLYKARFQQLDLDDIPIMDTLYMLRLDAFRNNIYGMRQLFARVITNPVDPDTLKIMAEVIKELEEENTCMKICEELNTFAWPVDVQKALRNNSAVLQIYLSN